MIYAFGQGDLKTMGALAHKIKPSTDNLQITSISQDIRSIEKAGRDNTSPPGLESSLNKVARTIERVVMDMKQDYLGLSG